MKKILLYSILALSIFSLVSESTNALSYGGSPQFSIPGIYSNTGVQLYSASYGVPASGLSTYPTLDADLGDTRLLSYTFGLRFTSGSLMNSGTLANITFHYGNSWGAGGVTWWGDSSHWVYNLTFKANASTDGKTYIYLTSERNDYGAYIGAGAYYDKFDLPQFTLPSNMTCPGVSSDCILVIQPRFYVKEAGANPGLYIPYIDYTLYYGSDYKTQYYRAYFGDLSANGPTPTAWESLLEFFGLHQSGYGLFTGYNTAMTQVGGPYTPNPIWRADVGGMAGVSPIVWTRTNAPANDDTLLRDYFVGNTGSIIETLFPSWVGSTGLQVSTIGADGTITTPTNGSGTSTGYFSSCTSFLDVGCYVQGMSSQLGDTLTGFIPSWLSTSSGGLFDLSTNSGAQLFTGSFVSFDSAYFFLNQSGSCTIGSVDIYQYDLLEHEPGTPINSEFLTFTTANYSNNLILKKVLGGVDFLMNKSIGFIGRVTGLFFGTALPPMDNGDVCFMGKVMTIKYQKFIPTHDDLTPAQFNRVNSYIPGTPTTFDWIARAVASMMLMFLLFASFRNISSNHT